MMSESDREITELAAKAAGEEVEWLPSQKVFYRKAFDWPRERGFFAPLHDDGEALRLAIRLMLTVEQSPFGVAVRVLGSNCSFEGWGDGREAATRRAIVRAAAEIGKATA